MFTNRKFAYVLSSFIIIFSLTFSGLQPATVSAQERDGIKRQINADSGRVSFIGPENGHVLSALQALGTSIRPTDPAMSLAKHFGSEFGLRSPERELSAIKTNRSEDGRMIVRYQQKYQGIPVMGGELIVNTNDNGDLYSMSGEVSPNLSLQTQPKIDSAQARASALQALAKYYQKAPADFIASEPELWIFDESLLQPSKRPVELAWRMEVTSADNSIPVRELVLVNAQRGGISLHFNQVDTAWPAQTSDQTNNILRDPNPIETPLPIKTPFPTETPASTENTSPDGGVVPLVVTTWYTYQQQAMMQILVRPQGLPA